jgi:preprotein translocase subunit YajC
MKVVYRSIRTFAALVLTTSFATATGFAEMVPGAGGPRQALNQVLPFIAIFGIMYFLIFRPQQKKARLHQQFLTDLKRGDMVVSASGIVGTIKNLSDKFITLEIDDGVCIKVVRNQILESANNLKDDKEEKR